MGFPSRTPRESLRGRWCLAQGAAGSRSGPRRNGLDPLVWPLLDPQHHPLSWGGSLLLTTAVLRLLHTPEKHGSKNLLGQWGCEALELVLDWETPKLRELWRVRTAPEPPALTLGSRRSQKPSKKEANSGFLHTRHATHLQRPRKASSEEKRLLILCRKGRVRTILLQLPVQRH